ncbi:MAG: PilZ domain-containing protein [Candidatus Eremiobacteraeota bacterium]|nr:PilZ domain-containing protein [Candidatus Eremiobacteraeota bacterium]
MSVKKVLDEVDEMYFSRELVIEKRDAARVPLGETSFYFTYGGRCHQARIIDISFRGIKMALEHHLPPVESGEVLIFYNGTSLLLPLRIAWSRQRRSISECGAEFLSLSPEIKGLIRRYLSFIRYQAELGASAA